MLEGAGQGANTEHQELTAHGRQKQTLPFYERNVHTQQWGGGATMAPAFPPSPPSPCPDSERVWAEQSSSWAVWMGHVPPNGAGLQSKLQGLLGRRGEI